MIALETLAVANWRRTQVALKRLAAAVSAAVDGIANAFRRLVPAIKAAWAAMDGFLQRWVKPGYFIEVHTGKIRRDHSYFRRRAKRRRAFLKQVREAKARAARP